MPARSEPLLWVQLLGVGVFPVEALLLLLLLAGSDPGPVPALERLLCWGLGALAPTLLLWRRPADVWSLLLLQTPLRARRPLQQRLSRLQDNLGLRLALALGGVISLPLLWWLDEHAAVASPLSPLAGSPRLVALLLASLLLALMLWQWQQLLQALWLLSRTPEAVAAARPMPQAELEEQRLCLGLPLLLLDPLQLVVAPAVAARGSAAAVAAGPVAAASPPAAPAEAAATRTSPVRPVVDLPTDDQQPSAGLPSAGLQSAVSAPAEGQPAPLEGLPSTSPAIVLSEPQEPPAGSGPGASRPDEPAGARVREIEAEAAGDSEATAPQDSLLEPQASAASGSAGRESSGGPERQGSEELGPEAVVPQESEAAEAPDAAPGSADGIAVAVEPEQPAEQGEGGQLDQQIG